MRIFYLLLACFYSKCWCFIFLCQGQTLVAFTQDMKTFGFGPQDRYQILMQMMLAQDPSIGIFQKIYWNRWSIQTGPLVSQIVLTEVKSAYCWTTLLVSSGMTLVVWLERVLYAKYCRFQEMQNCIKLLDAKSNNWHYRAYTFLWPGRHRKLCSNRCVFMHRKYKK